MRVAMLSMHTSPLARLGVGHGGGMNVYVRELSNNLAKRGIEVDVFTASNDGAGNIVDLRSRVRVHQIPVANDSDRSNAEAASEFADGVRDHIEAAGGTDVLHAHYWLSGIAGHRLKHDLDVPLVSTFHTLERVKAEAGIVDSSTERSRTEAEIIGCSDVVVASNLIEMADIRRLYDQSANIETVMPGIDTFVFAPGDATVARTELGLPLDVPIILFAGRIQHAKGLDRAVEALRQVVAMHPETLLVVAGGPSGTDGERELGDVQSLVARYGLEHHVRFVGPQSRNDLANYFRAVNVCVVPSRTESFGLVALEAAACATPVVASAVGGLQYVVQHGRTGFHARDIDEIAGALDHLLAEPAKATLFGATAHDRSSAHTWTAAADRMLRVYDYLEQRDLTIASSCGPA